jgi:hypothetical protein
MGDCGFAEVEFIIGSCGFAVGECELRIARKQTTANAAGHAPNKRAIMLLAALLPVANPTAPAANMKTAAMINSTPRKRRRPFLKDHAPNCVLETARERGGNEDVACGCGKGCAAGGEIRSEATNANAAKQRGQLTDVPTSSCAPEMRWPQCGHVNLIIFIRDFPFGFLGGACRGGFS